MAISLVHWTYVFNKLDSDGVGFSSPCVVIANPPQSTAHSLFLIFFQYFYLLIRCILIFFLKNLNFLQKYLLRIIYYLSKQMNGRNCTTLLQLRFVVAQYSVLFNALVFYGLSRRNRKLVTTANIRRWWMWNT